MIQPLAVSCGYDVKRPLLRIMTRGGAAFGDCQRGYDMAYSFYMA